MQCLVYVGGASTYVVVFDIDMNVCIFLRLFWTFYVIFVAM